MIAVIAGTGNLPIEACKNLLKNKKSFFVISLFPQDNADKIKDVVTQYTEVITQDFYKFGKILQLLKEKKTTQLLFIGKVDKINILKKLKFDWLFLKHLASLVCKSDKTIMEALVYELKKQNIEVLRQSDILKSLYVAPGVLTGKLTKEIEENINFGIQAAEKISANDIGQTVIVKDKMILAVEAIEGTDSCIQRGVQLGQKDVIVCKTAHQNQNKKYDLPTLGPDSLKDLKKGDIKAIAWKSNKTFIAERDEFISTAKKLGITLISV
jgi:UDP-2,3-diacylglucosamine hydrolase